MATSFSCHFFSSFIFVTASSCFSFCFEWGLSRSEYFPYRVDRFAEGDNHSFDTNIDSPEIISVPVKLKKSIHCVNEYLGSFRDRLDAQSDLWLVEIMDPYYAR